MREPQHRRPPPSAPARPFRVVPPAGPRVFSPGVALALRLGVALALSLGVAALSAVPADAQGSEAVRPPGLDLPVLEDTLENGLRVLALRRPGAPTASFVLRFDVGSVNERLGETGIAHFLEHLLFKGTTTVGTTDLARELALFPAMDAAHDSLLAIRGGRMDERARVRLERRIEELEDSARALILANEFDRIMTENAARDLNATTGYEGTTYFVRLPANRAELWFVLEADRMVNPIFREFYAERNVVAEERRSRVETSPSGRLAEEFYAAAYRVHPYGVPVIGHMSDIQTYTRAQVASYHERFYRPNNAVLAVVGDIDPEAIVRYAERYFGPIAPGAEPPPVLANEPPQKGERRVRVVYDSEPQLMVGWHVPDGDHEDAAALSVLARVLAGGKTSRLYRRLVTDDGIASTLTASVGPGFRGPRLFTITASPLGTGSVGAVEAALYEEIERLQREPPDAMELERVRNQLESSDVQRLASNLGLAFQLAESVAYHDDWRETFRSGLQLAAVTPEDVRRVARQYLQPENRTVAVLERAGPVVEAPAVSASGGH